MSEVEIVAATHKCAELCSITVAVGVSLKSSPAGVVTVVATVDPSVQIKATVKIRGVETAPAAVDIDTSRLTRALAEISASPRRNIGRAYQVKTPNLQHFPFAGEFDQTRAPLYNPARPVVSSFWKSSRKTTGTAVQSRCRCSAGIERASFRAH